MNDGNARLMHSVGSETSLWYTIINISISISCSSHGVRPCLLCIEMRTTQFVVVFKMKKKKTHKKTSRHYSSGRGEDEGRGNFVNREIFSLNQLTTGPLGHKIAHQKCYA